MYNSVGQGWRVFVTKLSERGAHVVGPIVHTTTVSTACFWQLSFQIRNGFQDHEKLMFLCLLKPQRFQTYQKKFLYVALCGLTQSHGPLFDPSKNRTGYKVCHDWLEGKVPLVSLITFSRKTWVRAWGSCTYLRVWQGDYACVSCFCQVDILSP